MGVGVLDTALVRHVRMSLGLFAGVCIVSDPESQLDTESVARTIAEMRKPRFSVRFKMMERTWYWVSNDHTLHTE
jgi:hypothetical protein